MSRHIHIQKPGNSIASKTAVRLSVLLRILSGVYGLFLLDTCFLSCKFAQVIQFSTAHFTDFVHFDMVDVRRIDREYTLYANCARHFADSKAALVLMTGYFYNYTTVQLDTLLVSLDDFVCHGNRITGFEHGILFFNGKSFFSNFN